MKMGLRHAEKGTPLLFGDSLFHLAPLLSKKHCVESPALL